MTTLNGGKKVKKKNKKFRVNIVYQFELKSLELLDVGSSETTDDDSEE